MRQLRFPLTRSSGREEIPLIEVVTNVPIKYAFAISKKNSERSRAKVASMRINDFMKIIEVLWQIEFDSIKRYMWCA